jgi:cytochrome c oxidase assembly protein subunit 15
MLQSATQRARWEPIATFQRHLTAENPSLVSTPLLPIRRRLALLSSHLVVALVALVVIGGATRVMEAGLACPDWPLCYGTLLPGRQMNVQVFLEWFHRLDAFVIGIALLVQLGVAVWWRQQLPRWLLPISALLLVLVAAQGGLGALTVLQLLPSGVVTAHLLLALTLVAIVSGCSQLLLTSSEASSPAMAPLWWRLFAGTGLLAVMGQCLLGGRMATSWAAQRCLEAGQSCQWLHWHRSFATPAAFSVLALMVVALIAGGWARRQWPLLLAAVALVAAQITLGVLTLRLGLSQPAVTVAHQCLASLLVALLAALLCRRPLVVSQAPLPVVLDPSPLEPAHG